MTFYEFCMKTASDTPPSPTDYTGDYGPCSMFRSRVDDLLPLVKSKVDRLKEVELQFIQQAFANGVVHERLKDLDDLGLEYFDYVSKDLYNLSFTELQYDTQKIVKVLVAYYCTL